MPQMRFQKKKQSDKLHFATQLHKIRRTFAAEN